MSRGMALGMRPRPDGPSSRGFWPMRDLPTAFWFLATLATIVAHEQIPVARWLIIHLLLLGGVTHAILVWSQYFSLALLRSRASHSDRRAQNLRLIFANLGAAAVFIGVPTGVMPLTVAGASLLIIAVGWHGTSLFLRARTSMPGRFGRTTRYYIASSAMLLIGLTLGVLIAGGGGAHLVLAHTLVNILGWIGLTVAGTIVTLWPTILRTRIDEHAARGAARALPLLAVGVLVAASGGLSALLPLVAAGLALYLVGLAIIALSLWRAAQQKAPHNFSALSVGLALVWWAGVLATLLIGTIVAAVQAYLPEADGLAGFAQVSVLMRQLTPYLAAGFAAQIVIGALSYLIPVVLGGGPSAVRAGTVAFNRFGVLRVAVANTALAITALPVSTLLPALVPPLIHTAALILYVTTMASFLIIMGFAMRAQRRAKQAGTPIGS